MDDWPPRSSGQLGGSSGRRGQQSRRSPSARSSTGRSQGSRQGGEYSGRPARRRPPPYSEEPPTVRRRPAAGRQQPDPARTARRTGRTILALLAAVVLGGTGYGWATVTGLTSGLATTDVIDPAAQGTTGPQNILLVGVDNRTDARGNPLPGAELAALHAGPSDQGEDGTDSIILIHIPAGGKGAVGFSIPRDSYVELAGGFGEHKINSAYSRGAAAARHVLVAKGVSGAQLVLQSAQAGARNSIQTIEQLTGLKINHYASVNLLGFYDISNAIGGVQVCVRQATHDKNSGANFAAGPQTVEGSRALAYVRQRDNLPGGDLDRVKRQQAFLASMAHKVLSAGVLANPSKLSGLIDAVQKSVTLDKGWDILSFAQQLQGITAGSIKFFTIPTGNPALETPDDGQAVEVDPSQVSSFVQTQVGLADNPKPPAPATTAKPKPATPTVSNASIVTQVYNATGVQGLAAQVQEHLTSKGFKAGSTGNSSSRSTTVIDYAPGGQAGAQQVVTALGGGIETASSTLLPAGTVRVYLGSTYSGPKGATSPETPNPADAAAAPPPITGGNANCIY